MEQKLDPEFKKKWVAALRSGKYKQGKGTIRRSRGMGLSDTYCCLGVGCDVFNPEGWIRPTVTNSWGWRSGHGEYVYASSLGGFPFLPDIPGDGYTDNPVAHHLVTMNDDLGKDFDAIADWIERNL